MADEVDRLIKDLRSKDSDEFARHRAADALVKVGDAKVVGALIQALRDEDWDVRCLAAWVLGGIGDATAVEPLGQALKDGDYFVRRNAAEALENIRDPRAVAQLITCLRGGPLDVRCWAAEILGREQDDKAVESLIPALEDEDERVRGIAASAIGRRLDARAIEPLINAANDLNENVRMSATKALEEIQRRLLSIDKKKAASVLCSACFRRFIEHKAQGKSFKSFIYYACRGCRGSRFIDNVDRAVAVLDHSLDVPCIHEGTAFLVNWYHRKEPFDFDEVKIVDASDFDIDELVMKLRNDMDDQRRKRYKTIPVSLSPQVELPQAQMHMLKDTFGRVETVD